MRRRGSLFVEVIISMLIFLIGVLMLMSSITFTLNVIVKSGEAITADQDLINNVDSYMLARAFSHDQDPSGTYVKHLSGTHNINIDGFTVKYTVYTFTRLGKAGNSYFVLQRVP